jgi:predicted RNA binding protein YcfA (HicA-like mRNA interferase family)
MAVRLPACSGGKIIRALEAAGFSLHRIKGSHHVMRHPGPPVKTVTVPVHRAKALKRATLAAIIKQSGLTVEEFTALL